MVSSRNTKSTKEETQKAQTNQGFSLCFLCWFCAFCVPKALIPDVSKGLRNHALPTEARKERLKG
jgi:hypothetical protein